MESQQNTPKTLYRILKVMYTFILSGTIIFIALIYFFTRQSDQSIVTDRFIIQYMWSAILLLTMVVIPAAYYLFKKKMERMPLNLDIVQRLMFYKNPFLLRLALLEACCIVDATFYLITGNNYILYAAIIVLIVLIMNFPNRSGVSNDLKLSNDESDQL